MMLPGHLRWLLFFGLATALIACGGSVDQNAENARPVQLSPDLSALAGEWVALTATDSGWIIYQTCDAGNMQMRIQEEQQTWSLHFYGQQEDYTYWVDQQQHEVGDTRWRLRMHTDWDTIPLPLLLQGVADNPDLLDMQFTSNQGDIYKHRLVKSAAQHKFLTVEQDCFECWGDECDEFEH